eukprot:gene48522-3264_t
MCVPATPSPRYVFMASDSPAATFAYARVCPHRVCPHICSRDESCENSRDVMARIHAILAL